MKPDAILALRVRPERFFRTVKNVFGSSIWRLRRIYFTVAYGALLSVLERIAISLVLVEASVVV